MQKQHDMLTYRHPRTLNQAFGVDATSANPIQHYSNRQFFELGKFGLLTMVVMVLAAAFLAAI